MACLAQDGQTKKADEPLQQGEEPYDVETEQAAGRLDVSPNATPDKTDDPTEEREERHAAHLYKRERIRLFPIWLRLIVVIVLSGACLLCGLVIGFGVIGEGENMWDVLDPDIWYRIIDNIQGD